MATKRLTSAYTDPGHNAGWNHLCEQATSRDRRAHKLYTHRLKTDPELWYESLPEAPRPAGAGYWDERHDSRYSVAERWLERQVGRGWDQVYSDLCALLTQRRNRRIYRLKRTLLGAVKQERFPGDLYIDSMGILRQEPRRFPWRHSD